MSKALVNKRSRRQQPTGDLLEENGSLEELELILRETASGLAHINDDGLYISVNSSYAQIFGYSREEMIGRCWQCDAVPESVDELACALRKMLREGKAHLEVEAVRKDGSKFWQHVVLIKKQSADAAGHSCMARDITRRMDAETKAISINATFEESVAQRTQQAQRQTSSLLRANTLLEKEIFDAKRSEKALKRSRAELADFAENAAIGLHWLGPDGRILWANKAEQDLLGYHGDEYIGHHISEFHVDKEVIADVLKRLATDGAVLNQELALRCRDGSIKHVVSDSNVLWEDGEFVHARCFTHDITARKQTEQALRESEDLHRAVTQAASDAITTVDETCKILFANEAVEKVFGYQAQEIMGQQLSLLLPNSQQDLFSSDTLRNYLQTHDQIAREIVRTTGRHKTEREIPLEVSFGASMKGGRRLLTCVLRDVEARDRDEIRKNCQYLFTKILAESESLEVALQKCLKTLCEATPWKVALLWEHEPQGDSQWIARACHSHTFELSEFAEQARAHSSRPISPLLDSVRSSGLATWSGERSQSSLPGAIGNESIVEPGGVLVVPIRDGSRMLAVIELISDESQCPDRDMLEHLEIVGSQIGQFMKRKRAEAAHRESEDKYRDLVDLSPDAFIVLIDCTIAFVNAAGIRLFGASTAEDLISRRILDFVHPDDLPSVETRVKVLGDGVDVRLMEARLRRVDGSFVAVEVAVSTCTYNGRPAVQSIIRDVSERKQAEEELASQVNEIARSNEELQQFAFCASHDLQEPLRKVLAFGDRLKEKYKDSLGTEGVDYLDRMQAAAGRMQKLINNLLAYSRVTTKGQPFMEVDLNSVVKEVLSDLELSIEKGHSIVMSEKLPRIEADPVQMRQLFQNLISNALKFRKPNKPAEIEIGAHIQGRNCQMTVKDKGIGFDQKYAERIFALLQRLHGLKEYEGTGIGLAICKKIVERHGGSVKATGVPDQGATFTVTLPLKQEKRLRDTWHEAHNED